MAYLLDANVLIAAKNSYYGFDFCSGFWEWLDAAHRTGSVFSIERVYDELVAGGDDLAVWCEERRSFFLPLGSNDVRAMATVNRWANDSNEYDPSAKSQFADAADSFLIAQALAGHHTVVTHERISDGRKRIKIPNAASAHGVTWCTTFQMLRVERARFVLGHVA